MKTLMSVIKTILLVATAFICVSAAPCAAQELKGVPRSIQTPEQIAAWFSSEFRYQINVPNRPLTLGFRYQIKFPDRPHTLEETLELRTGKCDDFAFLAAAILAENDIKSKVIIIKCRGLDIRHAICMYKDNDGTYGFISNQELKHTGERDLTRAVAKFYPNQESIIVANDRRDYMDTGIAVNQANVVQATRLVEENGVIRTVHDPLSIE